MGHKNKTSHSKFNLGIKARSWFLRILPGNGGTSLISRGCEEISNIIYNLCIIVQKSSSNYIMARGQMTVLRALVRRSILSRHLFSVKPICVENSYFSGAGFSEPDCLGLSMGEIHRRYIHSFSPSSLYFEPALHHFQNKHLKTLGNAKYFSVLFEQGEQISDSTEKTGAATRTESATEMSEDANSSEISEDAEASKEGEVNIRSTGDIRFSDPAALFQEMSQFTQVSKLAKSEIEQLMEILRWFAKTGWARDQALALYISASFFPTAVSKFGKFFVNKCPRDVFDYLMKLGPCKQSDQFLFPIFMEFCLKEFPDEIKRFRTMVQSADLTKPHRWFPFARAMKRKIIYHCGPTNSGKTYNALQRYMEAKSGIYCSPLRLLAMEVFDKVNALGVYCSLHTGQEKKRVPFANHVACTIEMASTDECYEVAVIDEIQMIGDVFRGFAWSRALLGLKADEIHVCGDPSCLSLVRNICADTGDELIEHHYGRFKPLVVEAKTILGNFQNIQSGDCIVAFSRREIFEIKLAVERFTKHRCCVIYGALPPETRKQQANLFNSQDNEYDVLVASDAVGMGLNLNIRRVVFYGLTKHNGDKRIPVPASQVKQIAGRAGRRGSVYPEGLTTTFQLEDLDYLIECMKTTFVECKSAGLFPFFEQVELFAGQLPDITFSQLLEKFAESCVLDGAFFLCRHDHIKRVAHMLDRVPGLSLEDRYNFCFSPVNTRDPQAMSSLLRFAFQYSKNLPVRIAMGVPKESAKNDEDLLNLETKHQVLSMYMWLSQHFSEGTFPYKETAERMASDIADLLGQSLAKARWKPESRARIMKKAPPEKGGSVARQRPIMKAKKQRKVAC